METIIVGRIPSKKNSVIVLCRGNRSIHIPSNKYREWHKDASWQLKAHNIQRVGKIKNIEIKIYAPDARKSDLTNKTESLMDLLVDNGIIQDDNWFECSDMRLLFGGIDRENPRAEIIINEI